MAGRGNFAAVEFGPRFRCTWTCIRGAPSVA